MIDHLFLVGACYLDTIIDLPYYPGEDEKLRATSLKIRRGGNCPNSLEVLQQLVSLQESKASPQLHLVSPLPSPDSPAVQTIASSFSSSDGAAVPVDLSSCLYRPEAREAASCYIVRSNDTGSRTIVTYNELREMTATEFGEVADKARGLEGKQWWHFEGRIPPTTLQCINILKSSRPKDSLIISVEVEKPGREGLEALAVAADVVFISRSWAEHRGHSSASDCLLAEVAQGQLGFCTWGARGACAHLCLCLCGSGTQPFAHEPNEARSSSGATGSPDADNIANAKTLKKGPDGCNCAVVHAAVAPIAAVTDVGAGDSFTAAALFALCSFPLSRSLFPTVCSGQNRQNEQGGQEAQNGDEEKLRRNALQQTVEFAAAVATAKVQQEGFSGLGDIARQLVISALHDRA